MDEGHPPIIPFDFSFGYFLNFKGMIGLYLKTRYIGIGLSQYNLTVTGNTAQSHPFKLKVPPIADIIIQNRRNVMGLFIFN